MLSLRLLISGKRVGELNTGNDGMEEDDDVMQIKEFCS